jgi:hypothetical protein
MRALTLAAAVLFGVAIGAPADASCKRFGFTVNDYGKDGPTKDAKELLDKHIAEWAAQNKIKDYKTGTKTVNCELFLNFVVFDEHTCTASANVCWNDGKGSSTPETAAATPEDGEAGVPPTPIRKAAALGHDKKTAKADAKTAVPLAAPDAAPASPPAADTAAATPAAASPAATEPTAPVPGAEPPQAADMAPAPSPPAVVETGTLPRDPISPLKQHAAATPDAAPAPVKSVDAVPETPAAPAANVPAKPVSKRDPAAASAAATAAAAAAERAAVAAETAAAAAKEAAAAAVAASAASHGAVVPPLDAGP